MTTFTSTFQPILSKAVNEFRSRYWDHNALWPLPNDAIYSMTAPKSTGHPAIPAVFFQAPLTGND